MHKSATKYNETIGKWCKNKHGASKIIDTLETYQGARRKMVAAEWGELLPFRCGFILNPGNYSRSGPYVMKRKRQSRSGHPRVNTTGAKAPHYAR
jgi:hypothetical protein